MRIGVIGLGFMGATHLQAWRNVSGVELGAVASLHQSEPSSGAGGNLNRPEERIDLSATTHYAAAEDLIGDASLDAVDLCTPSFLHADQAILALESGKHVLVEKPMALTAADCRRVVDAAEHSGKVLMVGHVLRFWPDYVAALNLVRSGSLGRLRSVFLRRKCGAPGWSAWLRDKSKSGGAVLDLLIHDFDFCRQLVGMPSAIAAIGIEDAENGVDVMEARLDYAPDGPLAVVSGGWHHPEGYPFSMEFTLVCDGGTLDFRAGDRPLTLHGTDGQATAIETSHVDAFEAELAAFAAACQAGEPPAACPPQESAQAVAIAQAANLSRSREGASVMLEGSLS